MTNDKDIKPLAFMVESDKHHKGEIDVISFRYRGGSKFASVSDSVISLQVEVNHQQGIEVMAYMLKKGMI